MRRFALAFLALSACDSTIGDDAQTRESPNVMGAGARLAQLNNPENQRPRNDVPILVTGVSVTAVDHYDETGDGSSSGNVFVQDIVNDAEPFETCSATRCEFSGITLFDPSYNPPALRIAAGDVVDVRGQYEEFPGPAGNEFNPGETLPEIVGGTVSLRFEHTTPTPVIIDLADLLDYETGRKWIGMLVSVENVSLFDDASGGSSGRFRARLNAGPGVAIANLPTVTNALFPLQDANLGLTRGATFASITGIVQYFYSFSISPRSVEDLQP